MMRCRPGIVTNSESAAVPDQQCTATLRCALHCIRETKSAHEENGQRVEHRIRLLALRQMASTRDHLDPRA
jgi:hypothetical protein